jgi:ABC-type microcin C transport system permease subunit YejB
MYTGYVIIESPYSGDITLNKEYAIRAVRHSISLNEVPFASHLLYTQVLDDTITEQRIQGMKLGFAWLSKATHVAVYCDRGLSPGMIQGISRAIQHEKPIHARWLDRLEDKHIIMEFGMWFASARSYWTDAMSKVLSCEY